MLKSKVLSAIFISGILVAQSLQAQTRSLVDPGISTHNYKHPNKAAKARSVESTITVPNINTVEKSVRNPRRGYASTTPKYTARPGTLVITKTFEKEKSPINPLLSSRNYKTQANPAVAKNAELANGIMTPDSIYPNKD
jgi:hypothetical protein